MTKLCLYGCTGRIVQGPIVQGPIVFADILVKRKENADWEKSIGRGSLDRSRFQACVRHLREAMLWFAGFRQSNRNLPTTFDRGFHGFRCTSS